MKKIYTVLFIFICVGVFAQNMSEFDGLKVKIELANPKVFCQGDEVAIKISVVNESGEEKNCYIADDKKYSFNFL